MALGWIWWRAWSPLVARGAAALCVTGVAFGDIDLRFCGQVPALSQLLHDQRAYEGVVVLSMLASTQRGNKCSQFFT